MTILRQLYCTCATTQRWSRLNYQESELTASGKKALTRLLRHHNKALKWVFHEQISVKNSNDAALMYYMGLNQAGRGEMISPNIIKEQMMHLLGKVRLCVASFPHVQQAIVMSCFAPHRMSGPAESLSASVHRTSGCFCLGESRRHIERESRFADIVMMQLSPWLISALLG